MKLVGVLIVVILSLSAGAAVFLWLNTQAFDDRIERLRNAVAFAQKTDPATPQLPELVRSFALRNGGVPGGPGLVRLEQNAELISAPASAGLPIRAEQWIGTREPGFVWRARGSMMLMPVTALDSYVSGEGLLEVRMLGTIPVAGGIGPDLDRGELMRYLAELPFSPDAMLNARGLDWRQVDASHVEVSASTGQSTVSIRFNFDAAGDIDEAWAADRPRLENGRAVPTAWRGTFSDYRTFGRYRIPTRGTASWQAPSASLTYWTGEITAYGPVQENPSAR